MPEQWLPITDQPEAKDLIGLLHPSGLVTVFQCPPDYKIPPEAIGWCHMPPTKDLAKARRRELEMIHWAMMEQKHLRTDPVRLEGKWRKRLRWLLDKIDKQGIHLHLWKPWLATDDVRAGMRKWIRVCYTCGKGKCKWKKEH